MRKEIIYTISGVLMLGGLYYWGVSISDDNKVFADPVSTSVTVANVAPSFSVSPAENPASDTTSPTNVGDSVTIEATATDNNGEQYYLAVCKTDAVTATNGGAPTCDGGAWCVSSATASAVQSSCSYTTQGSDSESNVWYAFVCDGNVDGAACSSSQQGTGSSGSPFEVNHAPTFNTISNNGPINPGASITWSTDTSTLDSDISGTADTVKLVICKTAGFSAGDCDGGASDRWCESSLVANSPSCSYSVPTPTVDQSYAAYAYLVDSHDFESADVNQGSSTTYSVSNVSPVVSSVQLNTGSDITLTEGTTTSITLSATVTDNNSCTDIASVEASLYRSGIGYAACDSSGEADNNSCYPIISCSVVGSGNTCTGTTDASADYTCNVSVQYFADPTDTNTIYSAENWLDTVLAQDEALSGTAEVTTGVEMLSLVGYDITAAINYGNLSIGDKNDPLDKITTMTATGNVGLDEELSGTDMTNGGSGTIAVSYQKYSLSSLTAYASGIGLTTSAVEAELNCPKTTSLTAASQDTWWGLEIPLGTVNGTYTGTNTIVAVKGETANW